MVYENLDTVRLFWRFVMEVGCGCIKAFREDGIWNTETRELKAKQRVPFYVAQRQGVVDVQNGFVSLADGCLELRAESEGQQRRFIEWWNCRQPDHPLCLADCCLSPGGLLITADIRFPEPPREDGESNTIIHFPNEYLVDGVPQAFCDNSLIKLSCVRNTNQVEPKLHFKGNDHVYEVYNPNAHWHQLRLTERLLEWEGGEGGAFSSDFPMYVDGIPLGNGGQTAGPLPRISTTPDVFWVGCDPKAEGPCFSGHIRRIELDPANGCWACLASQPVDDRIN